MTALLYMLVAVLGVVLGVRGWMPEQRDPGRIAFMGLGVCVALAYGAFALSLLPGLAGMRLLYMAAGMCVPAFALWTVDRVFRGGPDPLVRVLFAVTVLLVPLLVGLHAAFTLHVPRSSPAEVVAGVFTFAALVLVIARLWQAHEAAELSVEKTRLTYLIAVVLGAVGFSFLEQIARNVGAPIDLAGIPVTSRGVVLQGALPPFSALLTGIALYFMYQALVFYRLLDLNEVFSRLIALVASAALLVVVDGVTVMWIGTFTDYPFHGTFQIFVASMLFLMAYNGLRDSIQWASNRLFNRRGQQLQEALDSLATDLPTTVSLRSLSDVLLTRLHATGRIPFASLYLWDRTLDAFITDAHRGEVDTPPIAAVANGAFIDGFTTDSPVYQRAALALQRTQANADRLALMEAMHADIVLPMRSRSGVVLGWLAMKAQAWSDGFSSEEVQRLREVLTIAGTVLANIRDFEKLEEQHRLAALGAMAAGLAHEIRNPLAGIKGAAQFLEAEAVQGDAADMLSIIVDETNRLDLVVRQFLDYARPDTLTLTSDHANALATHISALIRAQGLPPGVDLVEDLAPDLPACRLDRDRLTQVLLNLARNALQAMPGGGTLTLRTRQHSDAIIELAVIDTGEGIAPGTVARLFDPFFTTKRSGTGLGLAICERIVRAHGGTIEVTSAPGRGSVFAVRLPVRKPEDITDVGDAA